MKIVLNGEERKIKDTLTLGELIDELGIRDKVMAVAVDMEIVKKDKWNTFKLKENHKVELLHFVGGG